MLQQCIITFDNELLHCPLLWLCQFFIIIISAAIRERRIQKQKDLASMWPYVRITRELRLLGKTLVPAVLNPCQPPLAHLCHTVPCYASLCYTLLCHTLLCYAVLCCATGHNASFNHCSFTTGCWVVLCHPVQCNLVTQCHQLCHHLLLLQPSNAWPALVSAPIFPSIRQ